MNSGKLGEDAAVNFLEKYGYKICARNFRGRWGEIDIVAKDGDCIVFVEVKTRQYTSYGRPRNLLASKARRKLQNSA